MSEFDALRVLLTKLEERHEALNREFQELPKVRREWTAIIISLLAAAFALWSAYESYRAVSVQVDAMQLSARPFLVPVGATWVGIPPDPQAGNFLLVTASLKMALAGVTPALRVSVKTNCEVYKDGAKEIPKIEGPNSKVLGVSEAGLLHGSETTLDTACQTLSPAFDTPGQRRYAIIGRVTYSDYFGRSHVSDFCFEGWISNRDIHPDGSGKGELKGCLGDFFKMT